MRKDLKDTEVPEEEWYDEAVKSRSGWRALYRGALECIRETEVTRVPEAARDVVSEACSRRFSRESNKARHKCIDERRKPNEVQFSVSNVSNGSGVKEDW